MRHMKFIARLLDPKIVRGDGRPKDCVEERHRWRYSYKTNRPYCGGCGITIPHRCPTCGSHKADFRKRVPITVDPYFGRCGDIWHTYKGQTWT